MLYQKLKGTYFLHLYPFIFRHYCQQNVLTIHCHLRDSSHQLICDLEGVHFAAVDWLQRADHTEDPRRVLPQVGSGL